MVRGLLLLIAALVAGALLAWLLAPDAGYVLLRYRDWVIESTLLGFGLSVVAVLVVGWALLVLLRTALRLPGAWRGYRDRRRVDRARRAFDDGLMLLAEGRWRQAEHELVRRAADHDPAVLNYCAAAIAAQMQAAAARRDRYLQLAINNAVVDPVAPLVIQARLLAAAGDPAAARSALTRLRAQEPAHAEVIRLLADVLEQERDWRALHTLLGDARHHQALPAERQLQLERRAASALLAEAAAAGDLDAAKATLNGLPKPLLDDPVMRHAQVRALLRLDAHRDAAAIVDAALQRDWDGELVLLYGRLEIDDGIAQLSSVEQWLSRYGERAELLLTAGRVCMRAQLWGKARSYLDAAAAQAPTTETWIALARWCEAAQRPDEAPGFWRRAAEAAAPEAVAPNPA